MEKHRFIRDNEGKEIHENEENDGNKSPGSQRYHLVEFLECGTKINADMYAVTLIKLRTAIKWTRSILLIKGVFLRHDNV